MSTAEKIKYAAMPLRIPYPMTVVEYAAMEQEMFKGVINKLSGYQTQTTFFQDFSIAEFTECYMNGKGAIRKTFDKTVKEWIKDTVRGTELVLVLNHKCWEHHELGNKELRELYRGLFYEAHDAYCEANKDNEDAMSYFYEVTD